MYLSDNWVTLSIVGCCILQKSPDCTKTLLMLVYRQRANIQPAAQGQGATLQAAWATATKREVKQNGPWNWNWARELCEVRWHNEIIQCRNIQSISPVAVVSYVDNWEAQSTQPEATCAALEAMDSFASELQLDIKLDRAKTYSWGTTPASRKTLKARGHTVMLHAKDLGGHLDYSKRGTNYSVRARITQSKPMWGWLSRSQASAHRKLRILFTVAWPRCLHGVSAVDIGIDHVTTLRASAMSALRWEKHGSSSCIQFGLITDPRRDPHTSMQFCWPWPSFDSTANPILRMRSLTFWLANRQPGTCQVLVGSSLLDCTKSIGNAATCEGTACARVGRISWAQHGLTCWIPWTCRCWHSV